MFDEDTALESIVVAAMTDGTAYPNAEEAVTAAIRDYMDLVRSKLQALKKEAILQVAQEWSENYCG